MADAATVEALLENGFGLEVVRREKPNGHFGASWAVSSVNGAGEVSRAWHCGRRLPDNADPSATFCRGYVRSSFSPPPPPPAEAPAVAVPFCAGRPVLERVLARAGTAE